MMEAARVLAHSRLPGRVTSRLAFSSSTAISFNMLSIFLFPICKMRDIIIKINTYLMLTY